MRLIGTASGATASSNSGSEDTWGYLYGMGSSGRHHHGWVHGHVQASTRSQRLVISKDGWLQASLTRQHRKINRMAVDGRGRTFGSGGVQPFGRALPSDTGMLRLTSTF